MDSKHSWDLNQTNHFGAIRLCLALLVIFSHSWPLTGGSAQVRWEPLEMFTRGQLNFGELAVNLFFALSGFLILHSWQREPDFARFLKKRVLRIYPAYLLVAVVCAVLIAPLAGAHHPPGIAFVMDTLRLQMPSLPGVFASNPDPGEIDGSLWTIRYEFSCYLLIGALGLLGAYRYRWMVPALLGTMLALLIWHPHASEPFLAHGLIPVPWGDPWPRLLGCFAAGMACYLYRASIPKSRYVALASLAVLLLTSQVGGLRAVMPLLGTYLLFYAGFHPRQWLPRLDGVDISYGVYLYAFPIQQLLIRWLPGIHPLQLFALATPLTIGAGLLSWHCMEAPALRWRKAKAIQLPSAASGGATGSQRQPG